MPLHFAEAMVKHAAEETKRRARSYPRAMLAALPAVAVQSLGDVPKGAIERTTEDLVGGTRPTAERAFRLGRSKALGRFGAASLTTPLFLSGVEDLKSDDKDRRRRGTLKVLGAGTGFSAAKGGLETALDKGLRSPDVARAVRGALTARGAVGAASGLLTAKAIAGSLKGHEKQEKSRKARLMPYLVGGGTGLAEGVAESAMSRGLKTGPAVRAAVAKGLGRASGGVFGAALLTEIAKRVGEKEKRAEALIGSDAHAAYLAAYDWTKQQPSASVAQEALSIQRQGAVTPYRRAVMQGLIDGSKGREPRRPEKPGAADAALIGVVLAAPQVALGVIETLPPAQRDLLLRDAIDRMAVARAINIQSEFNGKAVGRGGEMSLGKTLYLSPESSPAAAAHELGHATAGARRRALLHTQGADVAYRAAAGVASLVPLAVLLATSESDFAMAEDYEARAEFLSRLGKVTALAAAPRLVEEGLASTKAAWYLAQAGATRQQMLEQAFARNLPAFATYVAPLAIPFIAARQLRRKAKKTESP